MKNKALMTYYLSMIVYLFGAIIVILFGVVIEPVVSYYHEQTHTMTSPIFGNFYNFLMGLAIIGTVLTTSSLVLFLLSYTWARKSEMHMSKMTVALPLVLYAFSYLVIGVSLI